MGDSGETPAERRPHRTEDHVTSRETQVGSGAPLGGGSCMTEQTVTSLKVTIQQSSENRAFRQTDRPGGLHCHVCDLTCGSLQLFQEHMTTAAHLKKMREITWSVSIRAHKLHRRRGRSGVQRWCDTCQTHFSSDVISHRQSRQHKEGKKRARPFCPVCQRHFKTPRKFVEHMKSVEHKQQVHLQEQQEEELITVDAIGCFQGEEELRGQGGGGEAADERDTRLDPGAAPALLPDGGSEVSPEQGETSRG